MQDGIQDGDSVKIFHVGIELTEEQIEALKGPQGEKGDKGDKGDTGAQGEHE